MHFLALKRGILMTRFHNMTLICAQTTGEDFGLPYESIQAKR
ncbi:hypothetical protein DCCM_0248 [Desulfocucumis palustris]|uniref:Uncharacterized protein n=1 Tax=Desulfocucumis palustris TaxID=1898651 RepID=A0A2L2X794_9FIRM|nr:hypothetical protein DCCM_0248 [Desulfocucumis palustris]